LAAGDPPAAAPLRPGPADSHAVPRLPSWGAGGRPGGLHRALPPAGERPAPPPAAPVAAVRWRGAVAGLHHRGLAGRAPGAPAGERAGPLAHPAGPGRLRHALLLARPHAGDAARDPMARSAGGADARPAAPA